MKSTGRQSHILDQQQALGAYLDALLEAAPQPMGTALDVGPEVAAADVAAAALPDAAAPAGTPAPTAVTARTEAATPPPAVAGCGEAALIRLQCFDVAGLVLAVDADAVEAMVDAPWVLQPLSDAAAPVVGALARADALTPVIDVARLILPNAGVAQLDPDITARCRSLLVLQGGGPALACAKAGGVLEVRRAEVRWRGNDGHRLWLAGTLGEPRCALLDSAELQRLAESAVHVR